MKITVRESGPGLIVDLPSDDDYSYMAVNMHLSPPNLVHHVAYGKEGEGNVFNHDYRRNNEGNWVSDNPEVGEFLPGSLEYKAFEALYIVKNSTELLDKILERITLEIDIE